MFSSLCMACFCHLFSEFPFIKAAILVFPSIASSWNPFSFLALCSFLVFDIFPLISSSSWCLVFLRVILLQLVCPAQSYRLARGFPRACLLPSAKADILFIHPCMLTAYQAPVVPGNICDRVIMHISSSYHGKLKDFFMQTMCGLVLMVSKDILVETQECLGCAATFD